MKVAVFSPTVVPKDGYGNITYELARELVNAGIEITLFLPKSQKGTAEALSLPFEVRYELPGYIFRMYQREGYKFLQTIDISQYDLVHSFFDFPYCFLAGRSAKRYRKPYIMGAQGTHGVRPLTYFPEKFMLRWAYQNASAIQVPSQYTRYEILKHAFEEYDIDIIHNGVRFDRFQKEVDSESIRKKYPGKKLLLTVGGLWGRKGHDLVIQALARIKDERDDVMYLVVGEGNSQEELEFLAQALGVRDMVDFVGRKSGDELVSYFKACDIYVHTPKIMDLKFEGFGVVYLEASACGKPIVATNAGGVPDAVVDGVTGLIAGDEDIPGITERILSLLNDPKKAKEMGEAGKKYAAEHDWPLIAKKYIKLYEKALGYGL